MIAKAAVAAAYAARRVAAAARAAEGSSSLSALAGTLTSLGQRLGVIGSALEAGQVDTAAIVAARNEVNTVSRGALAAGQPIQEVVPTLP